MSIERAPASLPCELRFWTWREAIEVASRTERAVGRIRLERDGDQWVVRYRSRLVLLNVG